VTQIKFTGIKVRPQLSCGDKYFDGDDIILVIGTDDKAKMGYVRISDGKQVAPPHYENPIHLIEIVIQGQPI